MILLANLLMPLLLMLTTIQSLDDVNSGAQHICQGRFEVHFDFDGDRQGIELNQKPCEDWDGWLPSWMCWSSFGLYIIMSSNLCELYFYARCLWEEKEQADRVASMMSATSLMTRKR